MTPAKTDERDHVDRFLDEIRAELPKSIDMTVEGIVDRIQGIARRLQKVLDETVSEYGLSHAEWKVLSSLRWAGSALPPVGGRPGAHRRPVDGAR